MRVVHGSEVADGTMLDLSESGGWIATLKSYGVGTTLRLEFRHPQDGRRVGVDAVVSRLVRLQSKLGSYGIAVELKSTMLDLDPEYDDTSRQLAEHRIRPRRRPALWIPVEFHIGGGDTHRGSLEDVSIRGLRIIGRVAPEEGARVRIQLLPPEGHSCPRVGLLGVVRWSRMVGAGHAFGVDIEEVGGQEATEAWADYVLSRLKLSGDVAAAAS